MSLIAVEAAITIADASVRDALVARSVPLQKATRDDEPGCLVYCFAADPVEPDLIQVYELWESEEALEAHFTHSNYFGMRALIAEAGIVRAESRKHRVEATAPVYNAQFVPTASFD